MADYSKAIELNPKSTLAFSFRGELKFKLQDFRGAIADYGKVIELDPKDVSTYIDRGSAKHNLRRYIESIEDFDKAIAIDPYNGSAYFHRGLAEILSTQKNKGCVSLSKAGELGFAEAYKCISFYCK